MILNANKRREKPLKETLVTGPLVTTLDPGPPLYFNQGFSVGLVSISKLLLI